MNVVLLYKPGSVRYSVTTKKAVFEDDVFLLW